MIPLGKLKKGDVAKIIEFKKNQNSHRKPQREIRVEEMGLRIGKSVEVLRNDRGRGPVLLKIDESRLAIGKGIAMNIMVEIAS